MDVIEVIDGARAAERSIPLCLRGDLVAQFEELERQRLAAAAKPDDGSLSSGSEAQRIAAEMEALRETMRESTVEFRLRALPRRKFREIVDAHPPRRNADGTIPPDDAALNCDQSTVWDPLVTLSLVEPVLDDHRKRRLLDELLTDGQYESLCQAVWLLNRTEPDIPFSSGAYASLQTSATE